MAKRKPKRRDEGSGVEIRINRDGSKTVRHFGKPVNVVALAYETGWRPAQLWQVPLWIAAGEYAAEQEQRTQAARDAKENAASRREAKRAKAKRAKEAAEKARAKRAKRKPAKVDDAEPLPLTELAKRLPAVRGSKPPSRATVYRWATVGLKSQGSRRVKLKTQFVGGTICASLADVREFFDAKSAGQAERCSSYTRAERADMKRRAAKATARMKELGYL